MSPVWRLSIKPLTAAPPDGGKDGDRWKFYTEDFDISFGVSRQCAGQEEPEVVVPFQRVNSQLVTEEGCLYCTEPGKYIITFDNQYSYMRSKTLFYNIEVLPPTS
ncbi:SEC14-like protein 2 [Oratosquilla oratoria]|uniref:SEC14-like protein 2 n=1 Tax=Oratosquilla oratoria TaxID=337810 RepID=UPI003F7749D7